MEYTYPIAEQHAILLDLIQKDTYEVALVIGERSTGKTTDTAGVVTIGIKENISKYILQGERSDQAFGVAVMRQNAGSIKATIWKAITNRYSQLYPFCPEFQTQTELLETTLKGKENKKSQKDKEKPTPVWAFCKGFKTSSKSDTASSKGLEKVNIYVIDEAEEILEQDFEQLTFTAIRENSKVILICNTPHKDHWITRRFLDLTPSEYEGYYDFQGKNLSNFTLVRSKMVDNPFLSEQAKSIYQNCGDQNSSSYNLDKYCRDVLGLVSSNVKGKVFTNYSVCPNSIFDEVDKPSHWGLDFGFSQDPTALVECKVDKGVLYVKEHLYQTQLTPTQTLAEFERLGISKKLPITADNGGLGGMIIAEFKQKGWNIQSAKKGAGSVKAGILAIKDYKVLITQSSQNILNEFNNYTYQLDSNKEPTGETVDDWNHGIDAIRYALESHNTPKKFFPMGFTV
jgi:phage terminase large subunit